MKSSIKWGLALALAALLPVSASAQNCSASMPSMNFGLIPTQPTPTIDTAANLSVSCNGTAGQTIRVCIGFSQSNSTGSTLANRRLQGPTGASFLNFNLYKDAARTQVWGLAGTTPTPLTVDVTLPAASYTFSVPVYARLNSGQTGKPTGTYTASFTGGRRNELRVTNTSTNCNTFTSNPALQRFRSTVTAAIGAACTVTANPLAFGTHGSTATAIDAVGTLTASCANGLPYTIALDGGTVTGNTAARGLGVASAAPKVLDYQLYRDAGRTTPWTTSGGGLVSGTGTGTAQVLNIYGRVPAQATPAPNTYSDTVSVTLTY